MLVNMHSDQSPHTLLEEAESSATSLTNSLEAS